MSDQLFNGRRRVHTCIMSTSGGKYGFKFVNSKFQIYFQYAVHPASLQVPPDSKIKNIVTKYTVVVLVTMTT